MSLPNTSSSTNPSSFSVNPCSVHPRTDAGAADPSGHSFIDRRSFAGSESSRPERRQFGSSHSGLSDDGHELALAIDAYKVQHHRRYLTCDEMLSVLSKLGYAKQS